MAGLTANNSKMESQSMNGSLKPRGKSWVPGESGNPTGRPKGSRNAFSAIFVGDLTATWAQHGPDVLRKVAISDPSRFLGVCASVLPKDVALTIEQQSPGNLDPADWGIVMEILQAVKESVPNIADRKPGEVLQLTLEALRAHSAKTIEEEGTEIPPSSVTSDD
jgi:Family of unknown function (DUF5681)